MMIKRIIPYLLAGFMLTAAVFAAGTFGEHQPEKTADKNSFVSPTVPEQEMRGVWVTFMTLDVENETDKQTAFSKKIDALVEKIKGSGFNTAFVQVRPFCDAIYPSVYYPWSHILSGSQGTDPGFDPLMMICDKCGDAGIRVHAWINPYRISTANTPSELCETHPYRRDSSIGVVVNGETYLNPADPRTRELIVNGVVELLENYDIDGIQFDDYFYPEDCGDFDSADYEAYLHSTDSPLSLDEFRRENVSQLIREVYSAVHRTKSGAVFGVSPQGNIDNNDVLYADVRRWCAESGYIDYICPQLYYSLDNPAQRYEDAMHDWLSIPHHKGLKLYIGLGAYKAGTDADEGTWLDNDDILKTEVEILRKEKCDGFLLFSYDSMNEKTCEKEMQNMIGYINSPTQ